MDMADIDTFSKFPQHVKDLILSRMPLLEAVRTCILSKNWKLSWTRTERLVLDSSFFEEVLDDGLDEEQIVTTYISIVEKVLLPHKGPVYKFFLSIPPKVLALDPSVVNMWILLVSRCMVQDLTLKYEDGEDHEFPSFVLECTDLKYLSLKYVAVERPPDFRKLSFLVSLDLSGNDIRGDVLTKIIENCPLLENLSLVYSKIEVDCGPVIIVAPQLKSISVESFDIFYFILKNTPRITAFTMEQMGFTEYPKESSNGCRSVVDIFGAIPKVENITLNYDVLEEWAKENVPTCLPVPLQCHRFFSVRGLELYSPGQLRLLFCLARSSPKLLSMEIMIGPPEASTRASRAYLETEAKKAEFICCLKTAKLTHLRGLNIEVMLIKVILSCCPFLERLYLIGHRCISSERENLMLDAISELSSVSTQAKIFYSVSE